MSKLGSRKCSSCLHPNQDVCEEQEIGLSPKNQKTVRWNLSRCDGVFGEYDGDDSVRNDSCSALNESKTSDDDEELSNEKEDLFADENDSQKRVESHGTQPHPPEHYYDDYVDDQGESAPGFEPDRIRRVSLLQYESTASFFQVIRSQEKKKYIGAADARKNYIPSHRDDVNGETAGHNIHGWEDKMHPPTTIQMRNDFVSIRRYFYYMGCMCAIPVLQKQYADTILSTYCIALQ